MGSRKRELDMTQFLIKSCRTKRMFMAKANIKVRTEKCYEDSCVRYVIIYKNDRHFKDIVSTV